VNTGKAEQKAALEDARLASGVEKHSHLEEILRETASEPEYEEPTIEYAECRGTTLVHVSPCTSAYFPHSRSLKTHIVSVPDQQSAES